MCTNKYWIRNLRGRHYLVNCGKCPSCLQEKAIQRSNRIRANIPQDGSIMTLFVTLTYSNLFVPFFDFDEFQTSPLVLSSHGNPNNDYIGGYKRMRVYRKASVRYVREGSGYNIVPKIIRKKHLITTISIPSELCFEKLQPLYEFSNIIEKDGEEVVDYKDSLQYEFGTSFIPCPQRLRYRKKPINKPLVGVCHYRDVQNFIKRLRIILQRNYGYEYNFTFYSCSEYGETFARPHFHLLIFVKRRNTFSQSEDFRMWQSAICKAWPFCSNNVMQKSVEIARNAASYVSSYVNCITSIPSLFRDSKELRPKHSYSHGFGTALNAFSLVEIFEAYKRGDLHVDVPRIRDKCLVVERVLLPKYVISRFFPKFKGFSRLTSDEIEFVCSRPAYIRNYAFQLELTPEDCRKIEVRLLHTKQYALGQGLTLFDYVNMYSHIWTVYASNALRDWYESITDIKQFFYAYDNIKDLYERDVSSPSLEEVGERLPSSFMPITDANEFPQNVYKTNHLTSIFWKYRKDRRVRNLAIVNKTPNFNI